MRNRMSLSVRKTRLPVLAVIVWMLLTCLPSLAQATVFWDENFENHLYPNWTDDFGCVSPTSLDGCVNWNIVTDSFPNWPHSGTHSFKSHYTTINVQAGSYLDRTHPSTAHVYYRWYFYFVNFTFNDSGGGTGTKHIYPKGGGNGASNFIFANYLSNNQMQGVEQTASNVLCPPGSHNAGTFQSDCELLQNQPTHIGFANNTVYCAEGHIYAGTPGNSDAEYDLWINGALVSSYRNFQLTPSGVNPADTAWRIAEIYTQFGLGDRYIDDLAVGDARIGCVATTSTPSPPPPTGLAVK